MGALGGGGDAGASDGGDADGNAVCVEGAGAGCIGVCLEGLVLMASLIALAKVAWLVFHALPVQHGLGRQVEWRLQQRGRRRRVRGRRAGTPSHGDGRVKGGGTDVIVGVVGDVVAC